MGHVGWGICGLKTRSAFTKSANLVQELIVDDPGKSLLLDLEKGCASQQRIAACLMIGTDTVDLL